MNGKVIVVQGYLASGKSTFALALARELGIPYFVKDTFKSALCQSIPIDSREVSSRFSAVTFDAMMYAAERLMEADMPLIIEGNFLPAGIKKTDEAGAIRLLVEKYDFRSLTFKFAGNINVLYERFAAREGSPERGKANMMFTMPTIAEFETFCRNMDGFDIGGEVVEIDTTDLEKVDFKEYIKAAQTFIMQQ